MIILTLGPILFADFEIPESINFGGRQVLAVHKYIGGARTIDAMGTDDDDIRWSGRFRGSDAEFRARYLDYLKNQGKPLKLQWSGFSYSVVISEFKADFRQSYEITYSITCTVAKNNANPVLNTLFSVDTAVATAVNQALQIAATLNIPGVESAIATVQSTTASVQSFEGIAANDAAATLGAISGAQSVVSSATSLADSASGFSLTSVGSSASSMASSLQSQASGLLQSSGLRDLGAQLGTAAKNIGSAIS